MAPPSRRKFDKSDEGDDGKLSCSAWWKAKPEHVAGDVFTTVHTIRRRSAVSRQEQKHFLQLYTNLNVSGQGQTVHNSGKRQRYNLTKSATDTAVSVVAQQRPRPMFITCDGDWEQQKQARLLTQAIEGQLHALGMYDMGPDVCRDGCTASTGHVFGYLDPESSDPNLERVLPLEVLVDHNDGIRRSPRSLYRKRLVSRDVLAALYPKRARAIKAAEGPSSYDRDDYFLDYQTTADMVVVIEAWHLRSSSKSTDGRHVMCVSSGWLADEQWDEDRLPFAAYRWSNRPVGYEGEGVVEQCRDAQWRINKLISKSERLSDIGTNTWVMVNGDSKVRVETLTNEPMKIVRYYGGTPPQLQVNDAVPQSLQMEIEQIKQEKFEELGLNQMRVSGDKPSGLDSGKAIREYNETTEGRSMVNGRAYEAFFMDVCAMLIMLNRQASKVNPDYEVKARESRGGVTLVSQIKWAEIDDPKNRLVLQMWPTSQLPSTPSGKRQAVQEWVDGNWISRPFAQRLLDFPDLDSAVRLELADLDCIMYDIQEILEGETGITADPYCDLTMAADVARRSYLRAKMMKAPAKVLLALEQYIESAVPPPPPAQGMGGMSGPGGMAGVDPVLAAQMGGGAAPGMPQDPMMAGAPPGMPPGPMPPPGVM